MNIERPPQPGLRLTAADRPGVAQPVPVRDIPAQPWARVALGVLGIVLALTGMWEGAMRAHGLRPGDLDDSPSAWAEQRRRIDNEPVKIAIVSDSRLLFDTNLARFEALTGVRPIQLALAGTTALPFLEDLSNDPHFTGLLIVGMAETVYFREAIGGRGIAALGYDRRESWGDRVSSKIHRSLERVLAFIDNNYRLSVLIARLDRQVRPVDRGTYKTPWKLSESFDDRQTVMWKPIEKEGFLQAHARFAWGGFEGPVVSQKEIESTQRRTKAAVDKIRARGGEVVFVRSPSAPEFRVNEEKRLPRATGWDALLQSANARGFHFDDAPEAQGLYIPEFSHLSGACAVVFTDVYVRHLAAVTNRLTLRDDAPPPLSAADCTGATPTVHGAGWVDAVSDASPVR